jgi:hypothetical protein
MKTSLVRRLFIGSAAVALFALAGAADSNQSSVRPLRVGTYDSRAVAIAYGNSEDFQKSIAPIHADYEKAKAAKDEKRMREIDAAVKLQQRRMHEQGFSTGSVAPLMDTVKNALPDIAKKANVQIIASKWELNYQSADVETVDVTDEVVALFHPNAKVLGWIKSSRGQKPVPIEKITDDMD